CGAQWTSSRRQARDRSEACLRWLREDHSTWIHRSADAVVVFLTRSAHGVRMLARSDGGPQDLAAEGGLLVVERLGGRSPGRGGQAGTVDVWATNQAAVWACGQVG